MWQLVAATCLLAACLAWEFSRESGDLVVSASHHKSSHHESGGGHEEHGDHHSSGGEKGDKGYKSDHHFDKGNISVRNIIVGI